MKRSELFIACANNYDCKSDCDNCDLYLRYREERGINYEQRKYY